MNNKLKIRGSGSLRMLAFNPYIWYRTHRRNSNDEHGTGMAQTGGQFRNEEFRVRSRPNRSGAGERQIPNRPQFLPDRVPDLTKDIADVVCGLDTDGVLIGLAGIKSLLVVPLLVLGVVIIRWVTVFYTIQILTPLFTVWTSRKILTNRIMVPER